MRKLTTLTIAVLTLGLALNAISSCKNVTTVSTADDLTQYVDPFIGSGDHGHVFVGANVPFGMVQLGPSQLTQGWDWCSGYNWSDSTIVGFAHTHLSGTGIGDLGDVVLMPAVGPVTMKRGTPEGEQTGVYSKFSHERESASPGFYQVHLDRYNVDVQLTATKRVGFHKYIFPKSEDSKVIVDLQSGIGWDSPVDCYVVQESETVISGYRKSKGWANWQEIYFTAEFSKPMTGFVIYNDGEPLKPNAQTPLNKVFAEVKFATNEGEAVFVKVALSPVSIANAKLNMEAELPDWHFDTAAYNAQQAWNKELEKVKIETSNADDRKIFYTALYHTMIAPSIFCDVNGDYPFTNYTTFSLWDTYRAAQPLMTILHPEKIKDMAATMLDIYDKQGKLPVWHLVGNETDCMVGNPGIPALADMVLKGYDVDAQRALSAMKASAMLDERGLKWQREYGYIPYDLKDGNESVAKSLEYALADWCVAQVAQQVGAKDDYDYFTKRSKAYKYYFDPKSRFVRGLSSKGEFREPFNPFHSNHREDDYTEGNAWQYTWLVPHDVYGLIDIFGGEKSFTEKLDSLFIVQGDLGEGASPDISGLIGQYAHGNEPSHHILYLYNYVGQQWKTAEKVREVLTTLYHNAPAGLCGNEDVGQMSAWYIMSAMGLYQVAPAGGEYVFGSPLMDKVTINVGNGKSFEIVARNNSRENKYIQSVKLNGADYTKSYIYHSDIMAGGTLEFEMGSKPSAFGSAVADRPLNGVQPQVEKPEVDKMQWWKDAKFGMFIHWGLYAIPAGKWGESTRYGEWIMNHAQISRADYSALAKQFNPTAFDADAWVKLAKDAGQKYLVITSKHHDGFAIFGSKASKYNVVDATPYGKDILKQIVEACRKYGIKYGFYYSQAQDWFHPGGASMHRKNWDPTQKGDMNRYIDEVALPQVKELLNNYPDMSILWWDTPTDMTQEMIDKLVAPLKDRPDIITNDRLGASAPGDLSTPEQYIPATGYPGRNWEVCMTMNGHWGYNAWDDNWKTTKELLVKLIDIVSKGGNFLLNVGPDAYGQIPAVCQQTLHEIGEWMDVNSESIYGTTASPFCYLPYGRATQKGQTIYLHVLDWPSNGELDVPLNNKITKAYLLADKNTPLKVKRTKDGNVIKLYPYGPDKIASVIALEFEGEASTPAIPSAGVTPKVLAQTGAFQDTSIVEMAYLTDNNPNNVWWAKKGDREATLEIDLGKPQKVECLVLVEPWGYWAKVKQSYRLEAMVDDEWVEVASGVSGGYGVTHPVKAVTASLFRLNLSCEKTNPGLNELILFP